MSQMWQKQIHPEQLSPECGFVPSVYFFNTSIDSVGQLIPRNYPFLLKLAKVVLHLNCGSYSQRNLSFMKEAEKNREKSAETRIDSLPWEGSVSISGQQLNAAERPRQIQM